MWQELYFESNTLKTGQSISLCFSTYTMDHSTIVFSLLVDKFIPCLKHIHKLPLKTQYSRGGPKTKWTKIGQNSISPSSGPPSRLKKFQNLQNFYTQILIVLFFSWMLQCIELNLGLLLMEYYSTWDVVDLERKQVFREGLRVADMQAQPLPNKIQTPFGAVSIPIKDI